MSKHKLRLLTCLVLAAPSLLQAQTGIGTFTPDPTVALHVKTSATNTNGPIRLEGTILGTTETDVAVLDASGRLRYRSAASLVANEELWINVASVLSPRSNRAVAIGQTTAAAGSILTTLGNATWMGASRLNFRDANNYIYSDTDNNRWYFKGNTLVSFRNRGNTADVLSVQALSERVGIKTSAPNVDFEVNGVARLTGGNALEFASASNRIYQASLSDWRFVGQTEVTFRNRTDLAPVLSINANSERVGVGTNVPLTPLHVQSNLALTGTGGGALRVGDATDFTGLSNVGLNAYGGGGTAALQLQSEGNALVLGANNPAASLADLRGSLKVGVLPDVASPSYVLSANAAGNVSRTDLASLVAAVGGDNLGNHTATQALRLNNNWLSNDGGAEGLRVDNTGRVGVGTGAPAQNLHVQGTMRLTGNVGVPDPVNDFALVTNAAGDIRRAQLSLLYTYAADNLGNHIANQSLQLTNNWISNDGGAEGLRVDNAGQVGIGVATPTAGLDLAGTMKAAGLTGVTDDSHVITSDAAGFVHRMTKNDFRVAFGMTQLWTRTGLTGPTYLTNGSDRLGVGVATPSSKLHVVEAMPAVDAELTVQQSTINNSASLLLIEGNYTQDMGFSMRYDGLANQLNLGRHNGGVHLNVDRNNGNLALGNGTTQSPTDKLLVNGSTRLTAGNKLFFGTGSTDVFIHRYLLSGQDALDIVHETGDVHVHAEGLLITSPTVAPVATFNALTQRIGFGTQTAPTHTLHIAAKAGDEPLRIDNMPPTPNNGKQFYTLVIDDNGNVYRIKQKVKGDTGQPFAPGGGPAELQAARGPIEPEAEGSGQMQSSNFPSDPAEEVDRLQTLTSTLKAENEQLRQNQAALEKRLESLARSIDRLQMSDDAAQNTSATSGEHGHQH